MLFWSPNILCSSLYYCKSSLTNGAFNILSSEGIKTFKDLYIDNIFTSPRLGTQKSITMWAHIVTGVVRLRPAMCRCFGPVRLYKPIGGKYLVQSLWNKQSNLVPWLHCLVWPHPHCNSLTKGWALLVLFPSKPDSWYYLSGNPQLILHIPFG